MALKKPSLSIVRTGLKELDEIIGGLLEGQIALVEGVPGSGKTLFAAQIAYYSCRNGNTVVWISTLERKEEFFHIMKNIGLDFRKYEDEGLFVFEEISSISKEEAGTMFSSMVTDAVRTYTAKIVVLDTIDPFIKVLSPVELFTVVRSFIKDAILEHRSIFIVLHEISRRTEGDPYMLKAWADAVFRLNIEIPGMGAPRRFMEILKIRGRPVGRMVYEIDLLPKKGVEVHPTGVIEELEASVSMEDRISTGIEGLDKILGGGLIRSTSILIMGPSGSGKTVLLASIGANMALRGLKVYFITFEEPCQQIIETLRFLGFDPEKLLDRNMFIKSINPRTITVTAFFGIVTSNVECNRDSVIILDGVHAIRKEFGDIFHRHVRDLITYCKYKGSTVLLSMIYSPENEWEAVTLLSTVVDGLIELIMRKENAYLKRYMLIRKMRLIEVEPKFYEFKLVNRKITVIP